MNIIYTTREKLSWLEKQKARKKCHNVKNEHVPKLKNISSPYDRLL